MNVMIKKAGTSGTSGYSEEDYYIYHYRDYDKNEVGIVIENARGDIVGVEVKAGASLTSKDLQGAASARF